MKSSEERTLNELGVVAADLLDELAGETLPDRTRLDTLRK